MHTTDASFNANFTRKTGKRVFVFDVDDTLADFMNPCFELLNKVTKNSFTTKDIVGTDLETLFQIPTKDLKTIFAKHEFYLNLPLINSFVKYTTKAAKTANFKVWIVSNRIGYCEDAKTVTKMWLDHFNIPHDRLFVLPFEVPKTDVFTPDVVCLYDDNIKHVLKAHSSGVNSILVNSKWNQDRVFDSRVDHSNMLAHVQTTASNIKHGYLNGR